jgi:hypothetical protein
LSSTPDLPDERALMSTGLLQIHLANASQSDRVRSAKKKS